MSVSVSQIAADYGYFIDDIYKALQELRRGKRQLDVYKRMGLRKYDDRVQECLGQMKVMADRLYTICSNQNDYIGQ